MAGKCWRTAVPRGASGSRPDTVAPTPAPNPHLTRRAEFLAGRREGPQGAHPRPGSPGAPHARQRSGPTRLHRDQEGGQRRHTQSHPGAGCARPRACFCATIPPKAPTWSSSAETPRAPARFPNSSRIWPSRWPSSALRPSHEPPACRRPHAPCPPLSMDHTSRCSVRTAVSRRAAANMQSRRCDCMALCAAPGLRPGALCAATPGTAGAADPRSLLRRP